MDCCIVVGAPISRCVSALGNVQTSIAFHPRSTFIHTLTKKSHDGVHAYSLSFRAQRTDQDALTAVHRTRPSGVVSDSSGLSQICVFTSVSGPSGVSAGSMHCCAMWDAKGIYLKAHVGCSQVSI